MMKYGSYPRYRLLVAYFIERNGWPIDQVLRTRLTGDQALDLLRAEMKR